MVDLTHCCKTPERHIATQPVQLISLKLKWSKQYKGFQGHHVSKKAPFNMFCLS